MIDIHAHILPKLDDGIDSVDSAIELLNEAKIAGFTKIVATTHYRKEDGFVANEEERKLAIKDLNGKVNGIEILLGNEIFANGYIDELIKEKQISTINNSRYILFELPFFDEYPDVKNFILNLISNGYKLILAHPERYKYFIQNPKKIEELINLGVYLQTNYLSILGLYGKEVQHLVQLLYKHNMVSFVATDVHRTKKYYPNLKEAIEKIVEIVGEDKFKEFSETNPQAVIENNEIETIEYMPIQKNLFGKYK